MMSTTYVVTSEPYHDNSTVAFWSDDKEVVDRWVLEHAPKADYDDCLAVHELRPDGTVEQVEWHSYQPEVYRGPLARTRVSRPLNGANFLHRVPIDCVTPNPNATLYEDHPLRCTATARMPDGYDLSVVTSGDFFECVCGDWQEFEGSPAAIAELTARYEQR